MKQIGSVEIPQEAFIGVLKINKENFQKAFPWILFLIIR